MSEHDDDMILTFDDAPSSLLPPPPQPTPELEELKAEVSEVVQPHTMLTFL